MSEKAGERLEKFKRGDIIINGYKAPEGYRYIVEERGNNNHFVPIYWANTYAEAIRYIEGKIE